MSAFPDDYDPEKWPDPLTFEGLVGSAIARRQYRELFREDGYAKSLEELREIAWIAAKLDGLPEPVPPRKPFPLIWWIAMAVAVAFLVVAAIRGEW